MFCIKCGSQVEDNNKFCAVCGAKVETEEPCVHENTATEELDSNFYEQSSSAEPLSVEQKPSKKVKKHMSKKKKTVIGSIVTAAVAVIAVGTFFAWDYITNFAVKTFSSPTGYYHYVENKNVDNLAASIGGAIGKGKGGSIKAGCSETCTIEVGDKVIDYIADESGLSVEQLKWLSNASISCDFAMVDGVCSISEKSLVGGNQLLDFNVIVDSENGYMYFNLPQLKEQYVKFDLSTLMSSDDYNDTTEAMEMLSTFFESLPDDETSTEIISRYLTVIVESVDDVEQESDTITANGVEQKCTKLTATIDEDTVKSILKALIKEFKNDEQLENIVKSMLVATGTSKEDADDMYDELIDSLSSADKSINSLDIGEFEFEIVSWVDASGSVIGRQIEIDDSDFYIYYLTARNGKDVGLEICLGDGYDKFQIVGGGKLDGDKLNGSYSVILSGDKLINVQVKDYDVVLAEDGYINGTFIVSFTETAAELLEDEAGLDSDIAEILPHLSLVTVIKADEKSTWFEAAVNYDSEMLVKLTCDLLITEPTAIVIPSDVFEAKDESDLEQFFSDVDAEAFIQHLKDAGIPVDLFSVTPDDSVDLDSLVPPEYDVSYDDYYDFNDDYGYYGYKEGYYGF